MKCFIVTGGIVLVFFLGEEGAYSQHSHEVCDTVPKQKIHAYGEKTWLNKHNHKEHKELDNIIYLSDKDIEQFDIQIEQARRGNMQRKLSLMG